MNVKSAALQGGLWFAALSLATQGVSWVFTFYVIRLLDPSDYGLMTMASILTAYLQMFSGLGLGAGIVQREEVTDEELDAVFWLSLGVGSALGALAVALAYPTSWIFHEPRVIPVTQLIGFLFFISGVSTVPYGILSRRLELRKIAEANAIATLVSSALSVYWAANGYGVYTLILTNLALNGLKTLLYFRASRWLPRLRYSSNDVRPHLSYGMYLGLSSASLRLFQQLDRLVVGRVFGALQLGIYGNAMTVASMPLDKIWPLYQQIAFPLFSRLQATRSECFEAYLNLGKHYLVVMTPAYLGIMVVAPDLVQVALGAKWLPMVPLLQIFCGVKILEALTSYHAVLLNSIGHHREVFWFYLILVVVIPASVLAFSLRSFAAVSIPWLLIYPIICVAWLASSLVRIGIPLRKYRSVLFAGMRSSVLMAAVVTAVQFVRPVSAMPSGVQRLLILILIGVLSVSCALFVWQRPLVREAFNALFVSRKRREIN